MITWEEFKQLKIGEIITYCALFYLLLIYLKITEQPKRTQYEYHKPKARKLIELRKDKVKYFERIEFEERINADVFKFAISMF